jgi:calcineurin-like phosphoesterase family protein
MGKIWFTSDLHFGHDKDFTYTPRGFNSVQEHDKTILNNFNSVVAKEDDVYILGDLMLGPNPEASLSYISKLNGHIHLIIGNHDTINKIQKYQEFCGINYIDYATMIKYKKYSFYLSHYPTLCANYDDYKKIWNLHGHTHSQEKFSEFAQCYNVALDAHNCFPVEIEDIIADIREKREEFNNEI